MDAADLRAAVAARADDAVDERERISVARFLAALDRLPAPYDEEADPTHVTGSAIVVGPRGVLLVRHRRLGIWLQPGGHVDPGESPYDAARREAREETGLTLARADDGLIVHVDVHPGPKGHTHLDVRYLLHAGDEDPSPPPGESQDVRWFAWDEAIAMADQGLRGALLRLRPS